MFFQEVQELDSVDDNQLSMSIVINKGRSVRGTPAAPIPPTKAPAPLTPYFRRWVRARQKKPGSRISILEEACTKDTRPLAALRTCLIDHHIQLDKIERMVARMGYPQTAVVLRNCLAPDVRTRSGDLGEILATEYVNEMTEYEVPLRRLRYRDDRTVAMRGDDLIGVAIPAEGRPKILKVESKSRALIRPAVVSEAGRALGKHGGRPNPSTLSFISTKLRIEGRDALAEVFEDLQTGRLTEKSVAHLIFVLSGNDPTTAFETHSDSPILHIIRLLVGLVIEDHAEFIRLIYESV